MATKTNAVGSLAARYLELLSEEGYRPIEGTEPSDCSPVIRFKSEGQKFVLLVDEDDQAFFALGLAYELGDIDRATAKDRANELNEQPRPSRSLSRRKIAASAFTSRRSSTFLAPSR